VSQFSVTVSLSSRKRQDETIWVSIHAEKHL